MNDELNRDAVERELANRDIERELANRDVERELANKDVERELANRDVEEGRAGGDAYLFRLAFDRALEPAIAYDGHWRALLVNRAARALDASSKEQPLVAGIATSPELSAFRDELAKRGRAHAETRREGRVLAVDGEVHGWVRLVTVRDVTERRRLETELFELQRMESVGQFTAALIHDFNNLLTPIACLSSCLETEASVSGEAQEMAADIRQAAERAAALARQTLRLVRREAARVESTNINAVVGDLRSLVERLMSRDVEVELALAPDAGLAMLDRERFKHVVLNLIANARDAMPAGGRVTLSTARVSFDEDEVNAMDGAAVGSYVVLRVTDTGVGMTSEVRERLFERFFTTKEAGRGTGLGLASVKRFVGDAAGCIAVKSEVGQGTSVSLYFPRIKPG